VHWTRLLAGDVDFSVLAGDLSGGFVNFAEQHSARGKVCGPAFRGIEPAVGCCDVALFGIGHGRMNS
jgi:hypothetical protein